MDIDYPYNDNNEKRKQQVILRDFLPLSKGKSVIHSTSNRQNPLLYSNLPTTPKSKDPPKVQNPRTSGEDDRQRKMDDCNKRKLALWHTRTFKPIMTHDELDPIMSILGFVGHPPKPAQNGVVWKEYVYAAAGGSLKWLTSAPTAETHAVVLPPKPRLPYPRIDGLHIYTYRAFLDAVGFYLRMEDISDLFHVRGMPMHRVYDRKKKFRAIEEGDSIFVYAEGSLDPSTYALYHADKNAISDDDSNAAAGYSSFAIRSKDNTASLGTFVPFKDIFV